MDTELMRKDCTLCFECVTLEDALKGGAAFGWVLTFKTGNVTYLSLTLNLHI